MALNADQILKHAGTFITEPVHVPAWRDPATGEDVVLVRGMTVREFEINQAALGKEDGEATAALIARCVVDESGGRVFEDRQIPQIAELGFKQINEIGKTISDLSGLSEKKDRDEAGEPGKRQAAGSAPSASTSQESSGGSGSELPET